MSRYIECGDDIVYKYAFGRQSSEMGRLFTEFGLGEYRCIRLDWDEERGEYKTVTWQPGEFAHGDELILRRSDLPDLEALLDLLKAEDEDSLFTWMVEAILRFMTDRPEKDEFLFEGEY